MQWPNPFKAVFRQIIYLLHDTLLRHLLMMVTEYRHIKAESELSKCSALDKLLGQLGIYATWLSPIAYLQKQLRIFDICLCNIFDSDYTCFLIEPSRMSLHIYSHRLPF